MTLLVLLAVLLSAGLVAASLYRLRIVVLRDHYDARLLAAQARSGEGARLVRSVLAQAPESTWEWELAQALSAPPAARRVQLNEVLMEVDHAGARWAHVPRVCVSLATASSFFLASVALRMVLGGDGPPDGRPWWLGAVSIVSLGVSSAIVCGAITARCRKLKFESDKALDALVDALEAKLP
jgi:hypothetical protein